MRVTIGEIMDAQSPAGGWTRETLAKWGVSWPPPKGWKEALIAGSIGPSERLWLDRAVPLGNSEVSLLYWQTDIPLKEIADAYQITGSLQMVAGVAGEAVMPQYLCSECEQPIKVSSRSAAEQLVRDTEKHRTFIAKHGDRFLSLSSPPCCKPCRERILFERSRGPREDFNKRQQRERELSRMPYREYLQSPEWNQRRQEALKRAKYCCQTCAGKGELHVHHRTYARRGHEWSSDLIVLCAPCHSLFHQNARLAEGGRAA